MEIIAGIFLSVMCVLSGIYLIPKWFKGETSDDENGLILGGIFIICFIGWIISMNQ